VGLACPRTDQEDYVSQLAIVTLAEVKAHLRYPNPASPHRDDTALEEFIDAANEVIEYECDDILPHARSETYDGGPTTLYLRNLPVLSVQNVEESWGYISYQLDQQASDSPGPWSMFAYSFDNFETGQITRRTAGNVVIPFHAGDENIVIQYTSGREKVPGDIKLAAKELINHWWQNSQQRAGSTGAGAPGAAAFDATMGANYSRDTESGNQNINIGVPDRILELIKGKRHMPFIA
jgi:hypothetical protein